MQIVSAELVSGKKVLLRLDIDVTLADIRHQTSDIRQVAEDFRLKAGLPTLKLCLENASQIIILGHIGRPGGKRVEELSVAPIYEWLIKQGFGGELEEKKLRILENLRFEGGEEKCDLEYAKELASLGDVYINEAFASYHKACSTTVLPTLLASAAGLRFAEEVSTLTHVRQAPRPGLVAIIGGAKVEDKLPVVEEMAKIADKVLVGGKIAGEFLQGDALQYCKASPCEGRVLLGQLNEEGTDITPETVEKWKEIIKTAKMIVWNGPLGKVEEPKNFQTGSVAKLIIESGAESIIGGGDTIAYLDKLGYLDRFSFVSTGGGAMLKFLETGTLPTIEALK